jgi:hypothetical protein
MKRVKCLAVLLAMLLTACGQAPAHTGGQENQMPTAEEQGLPEKTDLEFVSGEKVQTVPATLHAGKGYSIYVPDAGWRRDPEREERIPVDVWEHVSDDNAEVSVRRYGAVPLEEAVTDFLEEEDDYVFPQLILGSEEILDPVEGIDDDGEVLKFIMRTGREGTFIVSWKYRNALSDAASQAEQMAKTFVPD